MQTFHIALPMARARSRSPTWDNLLNLPDDTQRSGQTWDNLPQPNLLDGYDTDSEDCEAGVKNLPVVKDSSQGSLGKWFPPGPSVLVPVVMEVASETSDKPLDLYHFGRYHGAGDLQKLYGNGGELLLEETDSNHEDENVHLAPPRAQHSEGGCLGKGGSRDRSRSPVRGSSPNFECPPAIAAKCDFLLNLRPNPKMRSKRVAPLPATSFKDCRWWQQPLWECTAPARAENFQKTGKTRPSRPANLEGTL